jgi:hypothetical protein
MFGFGESMVGSISFAGGGPGNIIPVLGFFLVWMKRNVPLTKRDWIFIVLLMFIAVSGNKRSVVFLLPIVIAITLLFVQKRIRFISLLKYIPVAVVLFVLGVKSNPTLNPEGSRWGSFNPKYIIDYAMGYSFGNKESLLKNPLQKGRGGGFIEFMTVTSTDYSFKEYFFGQGLENVVGTNYDTFNAEKFGVASKGAISAAVMNFITLGFLGMILAWWFGISIVKTISNKRLRWILYIFLTWDYLLFGNTTITINADSILLVFICVYFNFRTTQMNFFLINNGRPINKLATI